MVKSNKASTPPTGPVIRKRNPSSLQKNLRKKQHQNSSTNQTLLYERENPLHVTIYHIKPTKDINDSSNAIVGFAVQFNGFANKAFTDFIYKGSSSSGDYEAQCICHYHGIAKRVASLIDEKGSPVMTPKGYETKLLVSVVDSTTTQENIKTFLKDQLIPDLLNYNKKQKYVL